MTTNPVISVILPVYNGGNYLIESVRSVLAQTLLNFELLVLDDRSTDGSLAYLEGLTDNRITVYKNESNKGLFYNLNFLIGKCNSPLIKLWSQDDVMYPHCLAAFVAFHEKHPAIGFSYCGTDKIDEEGKMKEQYQVDDTPSVISTELHTRIAYFTGSIAGNIANVCINRKALEQVGLFNEQMRISADFEMWVRLAKDHETGFIKEKLMQLRDHEGQLSRNESLYINHVKEDLQVYKYLDSYADTRSKLEGKKLLRNHKLCFYYTVMIKALLKGHIKTSFAYARTLASFDNFFLLSIAFFRSRFTRTPKTFSSVQKMTSIE